MTGPQRGIGLAVIALVAIVLWRLVSANPDAEGSVDTNVAVHVTEVTRATLHRYATAYGTVEPRPALNGQAAAGALVTSFMEGTVESIEVGEGSVVVEGTTLFRLDDRVARIAVDRAQDQADFAESAFRRQEQLLATDGTSQRAFLEARQQWDAARADLGTAQTELSYATIRAPLDGVVTRISVQRGQRVGMNSVLAQVVDLERLVVAAGVPVAEITGVVVGSAVRLGSDDDAAQGVVLAVGVDVDPAAGTYRVLISIPPGGGQMPGQFTEVYIEADERADALVVPEASVVTQGQDVSWVMVVRDGQAVRTPVTPGIRDGGLVEISGDGVEMGTTVVTLEAYSLPEETRVTVVGG